MKSLRNIKGTFDILPDASNADGGQIPSSRVWSETEARIRRVLERFGMGEIRTPIFEPTELVARGVGETTDIVTKEMFAFEKGDTSYVLRPEITAPVMRAYIQHHLSQRGGTQRLYYIGPCFRAERPQKGRYRQFHQFGVELIGASGPAADVEAITSLMAVYDEFGLDDLVLRINTLGSPDDRVRYTAALRDYLRPHADRLSATSRERLEKNPLRVLDTKNPDEKELLRGSPLITEFVDPEGLEHYSKVREHLEALGIAYREDPRLVRGLDYYNNTAFEIEHASLGANAALGGGGRYDFLSLGIGHSAAIPAVGFAAGIERLFLALAESGRELSDEAVLDVYIVALGEKAMQVAAGFAQVLRTEKWRVAFDLLGRSMKAQMREANRSGARNVIIIGDDEINVGEAVVKRMADGSEERVRATPQNIDEIARVLST